MSPFEERIRAEIQTRGPVTFRRFMEQALYDAEFGYYRAGRDPFGVRGDYYTNSQLQPVFGRLLARQIGRWREELGGPADFTVVELGAGRGETLAEIRNNLPGLRCAALERNSGQWPEAPFTGVVYANEFFDALPVHVVERRGGRLLELYVTAGDSGFAWTAGELSTPVLEDYIERYAAGLPGEQRIEVNLAAIEELASAAARLRRGRLVTIDYGYTAGEIQRGRRFPEGSLMSYRRHQSSPDVLREPGERDITAHVNFTALEERGRELGLTPEPLRTQGQFLMAIGEADEFASALRAEDEAGTQRLRLQLKSLVFGMGEVFRVLVQRKP